MSKDLNTKSTSDKDLVRLLKGAPTLKDAFDILKRRGLEFSVNNIVDNTHREVIVAHKDYAVLEEEPHLHISLHPYGSNVEYVPVTDYDDEPFK